MQDRDGYIPGVPCWVDTSQPDPAAAAQFYGGLFGWEFEDVMPAGSDGVYLIGRIRGGDAAAIGSVMPGDSQPPVWNTYVWVDSADTAASQVQEAGGRVLAEPFDVLDSGRMAVLADPEGAVFSVWEAGKHRGAQIVNEHGSVNFNTLRTRDLETAKAFYGRVFGWQVLDLGGGGLMWTLPGYAEHLEERNPGFTKSMSEMGAPPGFENVVASIDVMAANESDTPARWELTFAVNDADAAAARAAELGGTVMVQPFNVPWSRVTLVRDPQGAVFVAAQFMPETGSSAAGVGSPLS